MPRTHDNLFEHISSFTNLLIAAYKASMSRRFRPNVLEFNFNVESNLLGLQRELTDGTYAPGPYHAFWISDPKPRQISAAPARRCFPLLPREKGDQPKAGG